MDTPKNKPPTRESVEAAQRFAASLPALPQPQEKQPTTAILVNDLYLACKPLTVDYYKIDHRDMLLRIVERCHEMMATRAVKPPLSERISEDVLRRIAKATRGVIGNADIDHIAQYVIEANRKISQLESMLTESYREGYQAGLRRAAEAL